MSRALQKVRPTEQDVARFWEKVAKNGCWVWMAARNSHGYGHFVLWNKATKQRADIGAHVFAWEITNGPIPPGLELDHQICRNKACVNPAHMVLTTKAGNLLEPDGAAGKQRAKTHCPRGHALVDGNLLNGRWRVCRACHNERDRVRRRYHALIQKSSTPTRAMRRKPRPISSFASP